MTIHKKTAIALTTALLTLGAVTAVNAAGAGYGQSNCQVIYGGGEVCPTNIQFTLDKKVQNNSKGGVFVDNLGFNDDKFTPGANVSFRISVKNSGENKIDKLEIVDTLPQYVSFVSGPGKYNESNRTISYSITNLEKNATNEQTFVVKVNDEANLPKNEGVTCLTNNVRGTDNNGTEAKDSSSFCVQKTITSKPIPTVHDSVPVKKIPATGPELFSLAALIPAGLAGLKFRKQKLG